ncbi:MAG: hypothetical protein QNK43_07770 [Amphritea sp.]|nr:hypothetical protein [uncultured Amphritea sp.]MDX2422558.1 hypothetical protein [Amphritea sp.]
MRFIIRTDGSDVSVEHADQQLSLMNKEATAVSATATEQRIDSADQLLRLYVATDRDASLYPALQQLRNCFLNDLDAIESPAEIYGLIHWLLGDHGIRTDGSSLEETADRLSDIDIAADSDQYTQVIFHLKDAIDRLYEMELDDI